MVLKHPRNRHHSASSAWWSVVHYTANEDTLRDLYDRLNFGGTAHTEDQRASRR